MRLRSGNKNRGPAHNRYKHGLTKSPTYKSWSGMRSRCYRETCNDYKNYGARGITICERWRDFQNFLADMGERPAGRTLERIDNNKNYEPSNCCWATRTVQCRNRRYVRLSPEKAECIRQDRAAGRTLKWLSQTYGISESHALRVVNRESWA